MTLVAGADFGTLNVRVTLMNSESGEQVGTAIADYPLKRSPDDPLRAQQNHDDHMRALVQAMHEACRNSGVDGRHIAAFAADTTGSSVVMVDENLRPLDDYYLWCDHRAHAEAVAITAQGREEGLEALQWCGGTYSHEWGYAKLLHFLRHNPDKRPHFYTALEHCDMLVATLCGLKRREELPRSICAMGHKWLWGESWGGLPPQDFLTRVDPLFDGINAKLTGRYGDSTQTAGHLTPEWADKLGMTAHIPIAYGAFDSHWDAIGSGCRPGDVVNVVGTSTCIIALSDESMTPVPGICGSVPGSVVPGMIGVEAGQSATGDIFEAIARRAGSDVATLCEGLETRRPGQTGLLRLVWDNGDRTVLVRSDLAGMTLGWDLGHSAADEMHAALEGMAMHVRVIHERMAEHGLVIRRVINAGGIPQKNAGLNQIYANMLNTEVSVPVRSPIGIGACIFAAVAAGLFDSIEAAQERLCPPVCTFTPTSANREACDKLYALFREVYFGFGEGCPVDIATVLPRLRAFRLGRG
ncbi:ribulokinase [Chromohalobacter sarecensis]|uniref:Ribulokinase n=1 Tax=Chromohalobacter sarecensis TaxID=245294 RepID=A0ABV9CYW5_9GAMM|nr:ribulokinase [Chromohalobacter sarecensis]MCK0713563.1 ribulokinase [Chromohalobacter sarecensis]